MFFLLLLCIHCRPAVASAPFHAHSGTEDEVCTTIWNSRGQWDRRNRGCRIVRVKFNFTGQRKSNRPQLTSRENRNYNSLLCPEEVGNSKPIKNSNIGYKNWCHTIKNVVYYLIQHATNWKWTQSLSVYPLICLWYLFKSWARDKLCKRL